MTVAQLTKRIVYWQGNLADLGIGHWRVKDVTVGPNPPGSDSAVASVWASGAYDTCRFYFRDSYVEEATEEDIDETIIHEWLHVAWRDTDATIQAAEQWFPSGAWDDYYGRVDHEREGLIDRLSRALYTLHTH
jgi:hypothetical protein